jgi:hypothetical protein
MAVTLRGLFSDAPWRAFALAIISLMLGGCMQATLAPTTQASWNTRLGAQRLLKSNKEKASWSNSEAPNKDCRPNRNWTAKRFIWKRDHPEPQKRVACKRLPFQTFRNSSGSLAIFDAIRRASSRVSSLANDCGSGFSTCSTV